MSNEVCSPMKPAKRASVGDSKATEHTLENPSKSSPRPSNPDFVPAKTLNALNIDELTKDRPLDHDDIMHRYLDKLEVLDELGFTKAVTSFAMSFLSFVPYPSCKLNNIFSSIKKTTVNLDGV